MRGRRKKNSIIENFVLHQRSMEKIECLEAPADNARRVLDRLELEHMRHGGAVNRSSNLHLFGLCPMGHSPGVDRLGD